MDTQEKLLLLFDRPREPVFMRKFGDKVIEVPENYLTPRHQQLSRTKTLTSRFGGTDTSTVEVPEMRLPDITFAERLPQTAKFSLFIPKHQDIADRLIQVFMGVRTVEQLWSVAVGCKARLNPQLVTYALSVALQHRPDTTTAAASTPNQAVMYPDSFFSGNVVNRALVESSLSADESDREPVDVGAQPTAKDLDPEHRLAYFREDVAVNLHHWHWHLVYPAAGPREVVDKDRRGELFYYMHSQVLARYNLERFCNYLSRVQRLQVLRAPIQEAYYPKLTSAVSSQNWLGRAAGAVMTDIFRPKEGLRFDINDLELWRSRLFDAIDRGFIFVDSEGGTLTLTPKDGIDILGNLVEATVLSKNRAYYGNLHNMLHMAIAYIHDPDNTHLEEYNVMGESATAMRDPVFYRVHMTVEDIFQKYKAKLTPYTADELRFSNVQVKSTSVVADGRPAGRLYTHWQQSDVNLSRGLDFAPRGAVYVRIKHLQHVDFTYNIAVENTVGARKATVRVFLGPKYNESGELMAFNEQRLFMVEMDRFIVKLNHGTNMLTRKSQESSVTIPWERSFRDLDTERPDGTRLAQFNYCGCGWPHHMLLPRGTTNGYECQLVVILTNYADDKVEGATDTSPGDCADAMSYCGLKDKKWPDIRPMGFPFDRQGRPGVDNLADFVTPNMAIADIVIVHENRTVPKPAAA